MKKKENSQLTCRKTTSVNVLLNINENYGYEISSVSGNIRPSNQTFMTSQTNHGSHL